MNGVVAGVLESEEMKCHKMIKSIVRNGHQNNNNFCVM